MRQILVLIGLLKKYGIISGLIFTILALTICSVSAQKSPIKFINNTCTIYVDTTFSNKFIYWSSNDKLIYKFVNIGKHVTFIDSSRIDSCITKPKDTTIILLDFKDFFKKNGIRIGSLINETLFINIPFYYEGKRFKEKLFCKITLGKSKIIKYDNLNKKVNENVAKFFPNDIDDTITGIYPKQINFTIYYSIKNITNKPIWCTKEMYGWRDSDIKDLNPNNKYKTKYVIIPPHSIYKIPIGMIMDHKYEFTKFGVFVVFSEDIFEAHNFVIKSDFKPKGKYVY